MTFLYLYGIIAVYLYMSVNNIPKINNDGSLSLYFSVGVAAIPYFIIICAISFFLLVLSHFSWKYVSVYVKFKNKTLRFLSIFLVIFAPSNIFTVSFFYNNGFMPSIFFATIAYLLSLSLVTETRISIKKGALAAIALLMINIAPFPFLIVMIKTTYNEYMNLEYFNFNILIAVFYFYALSMESGIATKTIHELTKYVLTGNAFTLAICMVFSIFNFADISMLFLGHSLPYPVKVTSTRSETIINLDNPVCVVFNGDKMIYLRQAAPRDEQSADGQFVCKPPSKNMPPTVGIKSDAVTSIQKYKPPASPASP